MNISVKYIQENKALNKILMEVHFYEQIEGLGYNAAVTVWVPASDSRSEIEAFAKIEALAFLKRLISVHSH